MGKIILLFLSILVIIAVFIAAFANTDNEKIKSIKVDSNLEFKTFTMALCEEKNDLLYCKDEVFVNCGGKISKAIEIEECNGFKVDVPEFTGFAVLEKDKISKTE